MRRVARRGGIVAAWTYHVAHVEPPFDAVLWPFYRDVVGSHFAAGARLVDERYASIVLPGLPLDAPSFSIVVTWTLSEIVGFVRTWSGVQSHVETTGEDPVAELAPQLERVWGTPASAHEVRWPVYLQASRL